MRLLVCHAAFLALVTVMPARAYECRAQTSKEAEAEVRAAFAAWNEAVMHKDLEKTMAIFSPSIHFQVQGSPDFGYAHLLANYTSSFARENAPQWQGMVENVISSPQIVTLFNEWKLTPIGGGAALGEFRGVDVFERESDCAWRVTASLNYPDKGTLAISPEGHSPGPAEVNAGKPRSLVARHDADSPALNESPR